MRILLLLLISFFLVSCSQSEAPKVASMPAPVSPPAASPIEKTLKLAPKRKKDTKKITADDIASKLTSANIVFSVPSKANISDSIKAQLSLSLSQTKEELIETIKKNENKREISLAQEIKISKIAIAKITSTDFNIVPVTPEEQAITAFDQTEWLWLLEPKKTGLAELHLSIIAVIEIDGDSSVHHLKTFEEQVIIQITTKQVVVNWIKQYWQWVFSTLILPLILLIYRRFTRKEKEE